jgi:lipoprotein-anchoring transpeptidase ErfK/SrfK
VRILTLTLALALAAAPAAGAQSPTPTPTPTPAPAPRVIGPGISAGGVDLSNLTTDQAAAKLAQALGKRLQAPVVVSVAGKRFRLAVKAASFAFDADRTARRAYQAGVRKPGPQAVPLAVTFRRAAVKAFAEAVARAVYVAPRDATVHITLTRMVRRHSHAGRALAVAPLRSAIEQALADPRLARRFTPGRTVVRPRVQVKDLGSVYGTVITVSKSEFKLRLFKRLHLVKTYLVAVGQPAYPTPSGLFHITDKQVNPTWTAPNSPWAGELAGQSFSGNDPNNPLKARWMGSVNGVGIHGTGQDYSIGSAASHGCIRMHVWDVVKLYPRVPVGTPVLIQ